MAHAVEKNSDGADVSRERADGEWIPRIEAASLAILERRELVEVDIAGDDICALANEEFGSRAAYSLGGGGDERGLSGEAWHRLLETRFSART
jgi:hypothetical protein